MSGRLGWTPNRFRYELVLPNSALRPVKGPWEPMTWEEITVRLGEVICDAHDPVLEVRIVTIDPIGPVAEDGPPG